MFPRHFHAPMLFSPYHLAFEKKNRKNQLRKERREKWEAWVVSDSRVIEEISSGSQDSRNISSAQVSTLMKATALSCSKLRHRGSHGSNAKESKATTLVK
ncbi:Uncharacterized protein TCM_017528 [Theobroma cacao]|uniref:Uncharacterized protein n=1 Tax=Theobroma cacao TaxID=3641 RepID=A0A061ELA6_THECC|nr:Uncharacterized protein TCM_017528 [Theobroma cacao]